MPDTATVALPALPPIEEWLGSNLCEVEAVQIMLRAPLSDNPRVLVEQLTQAEAWYGRVMTLLADANAYLDLAEYEHLTKIDRSLTVLERQTVLRALVVRERRLRDVLEGMGEALKNRGILGMSLMRANSAERASH